MVWLSRAEIIRRSFRSWRQSVSLFPLDCQPERERPGVAGPATGRGPFGTGADTDKLPYLCAHYPTGLIKGHIGPTLKYRKWTRAASVAERDAEAVPTRRAPPNGPREPANVRGLTVSTPVTPKDLTVSATIRLLGADGIKAVRAPGLRCPRGGCLPGRLRPIPSVRERTSRHLVAELHMSGLPPFTAFQFCRNPS